MSYSTLFLILSASTSIHCFSNSLTLSSFSAFICSKIVSKSETSCKNCVAGRSVTLFLFSLYSNVKASFISIKSSTSSLKCNLYTNFSVLENISRISHLNSNIPCSILARIGLYCICRSCFFSSLNLYCLPTSNCRQFSSKNLFCHNPYNDEADATTITSFLLNNDAMVANLYISIS